jgi:hypothetical protein
MYTRSKTNLRLSDPLFPKVENDVSFDPLFPKVDAKVKQNVYIDFDEASDAWKSNKKSIGNGCYKYICCQITKKGKKCKNGSLPNINYCRFHCKSK